MRRGVYTKKRAAFSAAYFAVRSGVQFFKWPRCPLTVTITMQDSRQCCVQASPACHTQKGRETREWHTAVTEPHKGKDVCSERACQRAAGCWSRPKHVRPRHDGTRVGTKARKAGKATYYRGVKEAASCTYCLTPDTDFFTLKKGHGRIEPPCACNGSRSLCYSCLHDAVVLHALEKGRGLPDAAKQLCCPTCAQVATGLSSLSQRGKVVHHAPLPYVFPSATERRKAAVAYKVEHGKSEAWLRLVAAMTQPPDIERIEHTYRSTSRPIHGHNPTPTPSPGASPRCSTDPKHQTNLQVAPRRGSVR